MNFSTVLGQICAVFCKNLLICDFRIKQENLWICDLRPGTPQNFVDLWEQSELKNLSICDFRTVRMSLPAHLWHNVK